MAISPVFKSDGMYNHIQRKHLNLSNSPEPSYSMERFFIRFKTTHENSYKPLNSFTNYPALLWSNPTQALCVTKRLSEITTKTYDLLSVHQTFHFIFNKYYSYRRSNKIRLTRTLT